MSVVFINFALNVRTIGAMNVSSFLHTSGYRSFMIYCILPHSTMKLSANALENFTEAMAPIEPHVFALSLTSTYFYAARELTSYLKAKFPSAMVVWGGIHPTLASDECIEYCDAVCIGEGEESFLEFLQRLDKGEEYCRTSGFLVRLGKDIFRNELRPLCQEMDSRPYPYFDWDRTYIMHDERVLPLSKGLFLRYSELRRHMYDIMASRGCPLSCTYCCNSALKRIYSGKGKILRFRSVEHILSELDYAIKTFPQIEMFNFQDDAFGVAPKAYLENFSEAYKARIGLPFHVRILPHMIDEKRIRILKEAGLVSAVMGLQSSERLNREIYKRPTTHEQFINISKILHRNGITGRYDAIVNNPYGNADDEIEVIRTFLQIPKPYALYVYPLAFFPFTDLTLKAIEDGKYDPASSGYDQSYGSLDKIRYPELAGLLCITPYTPKFIVKSLLLIREYCFGKMVFYAYWYTFGQLQLGLLNFIKARFKRIMYIKRIIFRISCVRKKNVSSKRNEPRLQRSFPEKVRKSHSKKSVNESPKI